jgi:hypothetical protein
MNSKSPLALCFSALLSVAVVAPAELSAEPQNAGQRAGQVDRMIPAVSIARGDKSMTAKTKSVVDWQDLVNTQINGRARLALDDGSVLNVGSNASLKVVKHDVGAQQTELELAYGKLRTQAQKISKPDGKFEVRTAAGVAGVVGTDFYTEYDNSTKTMNVIVYDGLVRVCNLAGVCVVVKAGQMTSVRNGDNSAPLSPSQAPLDMLVAASKDTEVGLPPGANGGGSTASVGPAAAWTFGVLALVPIVVFSVIATHHTSAPPPQTNTGGCNPAAVTANCG